MNPVVGKQFSQILCVVHLRFTFKDFKGFHEPGSKDQREDRFSSEVVCTNKSTMGNWYFWTVLDLIWIVHNLISTNVAMFQQKLVVCLRSWVFWGALGVPQINKGMVMLSCWASLRNLDHRPERWEFMQRRWMASWWTPGTYPLVMTNIAIENGHL